MGLFLKTFQADMQNVRFIMQRYACGVLAWTMDGNLCCLREENPYGLVGTSNPTDDIRHLSANE